VRVALLAAAVLAAGCHHGAFGLTTSTDNDATALASALSRRHVADAPAPRSASHLARIYAAVTGAGPNGKGIVAFDLADGKPAWRVDADVQSRIEIGGDFIVELEGKKLTARDQAKGAVRWAMDLPGTLVGAAADGNHVYAVWQIGTHFAVAGYDGTSGSRQWWQDADGNSPLGAPAAQGGLVFVPYFAQWLSILDGATGAPLTRLRGIDEQISMLRTTSQAAYYGSKQGVFLLDTHSSSGTRAGGSYAMLKVPPQLEHTVYGVDAYDPVQLTYTAADRARILWRAEPSDTAGPERSAPANAGVAGSMKLKGDGYAVHYFRYLFGFDKSGELRWAYSNPRVELVSAEDTGFVICGVAANGDVVAVEPQSGAVRFRGSLGAGAEHVLGASFDADGWSPSTQTEPIETIPALVGIMRDHDARFDRVKELAVKSLAKFPGAEVTKELLGTLADGRAPQKLKDEVVELLVDRKDPSSLPVLTAQLAIHTDYLARTEPDALGPVARAIGGLAGTKLDPKQMGDALAALQSHLDAPSTGVPELVLIINAMSAIGGGAERPALASHLLLYHADDDIGSDPSWGAAIVHALDAHGGPGEHELLRYVAADPRTQPVLASVIRDGLSPR
jgi:outer membrane protein assembly factor BamB